MGGRGEGRSDADLIVKAYCKVQSPSFFAEEASVGGAVKVGVGVGVAVEVGVEVGVEEDC